MIATVFGQIVNFVNGAIGTGSTITDGALTFIGTGSDAAVGGYENVVGSLGNIFG